MVSTETLLELGLFKTEWDSEVAPIDVLAEEATETLGESLEALELQDAEAVDRLLELAVLNAAELSIPWLTLGFDPSFKPKSLRHGPIRILRRLLLPGFMRSTCALINFPKCLDGDHTIHDITVFSSDAVKLHKISIVPDLRSELPSLDELNRRVREIESRYRESVMPGARQLGKSNTLHLQGVLWAGKLGVLQKPDEWRDAVRSNLIAAAEYHDLIKRTAALSG